MRRPSNRKIVKKTMPLHIMAEKALQEAVADAIAEHKQRGHPIVVWRNGKVVSIPPELIPNAAEAIEKSESQKSQRLYVKEKQQPYGKKNRSKK